MKTLRIVPMLLLLTSVFLISCEDEEVAPPAPPPPAISVWEGVYVTETSFWGTYYSPLVVTSEGTVFIAEHEIQFTFDETSNVLTFDWHDIKNQRAKGTITFSAKNDGRFQFAGSINPRAQDGPVTYLGNAN